MNLLPGPRLSYFQQPWDSETLLPPWVNILRKLSWAHLWFIKCQTLRAKIVAEMGFSVRSQNRLKKTFLVRIAYFSSARYSPLLLPLSDTISWPGHWPLIGRERSRDKDTGLWLVECDHVTWILASDWSLMPSCLPDNDIVVENVFPNIKILSNGCGYNLVKRAGFVASFKIGIKFLNTYQIKIVSEI